MLRQFYPSAVGNRVRKVAFQTSRLKHLFPTLFK